MAVRVGEFGNVVLEQRGALADAEQFVAQHAVGRIRLLQALPLRTLVAAQCAQALFEQGQPLFGVDDLRLRIGLARLPRLPAAPAGESEQQQHQQP